MKENKDILSIDITATGQIEMRLQYEFGEGVLRLQPPEPKEMQFTGEALRREVEILFEVVEDSLESQIEHHCTDPEECCLKEFLAEMDFATVFHEVRWIQ